MLAPARRRGPMEERDRVCGEPWLPAHLRLARRVTVPATVVDQGVHLPALIRPRLERLVYHGTLPGGQGLGSLPLPRPRDGLLGSRGGRGGPHRHPVPATPGRFPLDTRGIEAWSSHPVALRLDRAVTF